MLELLQAGGWLMLPIMACSVIAMAITVERFWMLRAKRVLPKHLVAQVWNWVRNHQLDATRLHALRSGSPLGRILAAGLVNIHHDRDIMKEAIQDAGRHVVLELERYLNTLGTIAAISPLLGLQGTVVGMIEMFNILTVQGAANPGALSGGISKALITTAAGLAVAIPTLIVYRYFRGKVELLVIRMEQEATKMVEVIHGEREQDVNSEEIA
ncbi:MAG: MotA/TolQ/ExbB proton channel family protein [Gammaproteobacteria bacterium]|nr:MotA/TolQ/ExbB proton channel family protein [Gammaproteobacteria bacterium]